jgi:hypothetical protein
VVLVVVAAVVTATAAALPAPSPNSELAGLIREAIDLASAAAQSLPEDVEQACADLEAAANRLIPAAAIAPTRAITARLERAGDTDLLACAQARDGDRTREAQHAVGLAQALKEEALDGLAALEFEAVGRRSTRGVKLGAPRCRGLLSGTVPSACFTVDSWDVEIDAAATAARCEFTSNGKLLTNLRPLFENVVQETTCKLTNRTVVVGAERKRIVRAELKLVALDGTALAGAKPVVVTAFWR